MNEQVEVEVLKQLLAEWKSDPTGGNAQRVAQQCDVVCRIQQTTPSAKLPPGTRVPLIRHGFEPTLCRGCGREIPTGAAIRWIPTQPSMPEGGGGYHPECFTQAFGKV